jgi:hypothetical protein
MKRLDIILPHEHVGEVDKILHKHNVGGMISKVEVVQKMNQYT